MNVNQLKTGDRLIVETENSTYEIIKRDGDFNIRLRTLRSTTASSLDEKYLAGIDTQLSPIVFPYDDSIEVGRGFAFSPSASGRTRFTSHVTHVSYRPIPTIILRDDGYEIRCEGRMIQKGPYTVEDKRTPPQYKVFAEMAEEYDKNVRREFKNKVFAEGYGGSYRKRSAETGFEWKNFEWRTITIPWAYTHRFMLKPYCETIREVLAIPLDKIIKITGLYDDLASKSTIVYFLREL